MSPFLNSPPETVSNTSSPLSYAGNHTYSASMTFQSNDKTTSNTSLYLHGILVLSTAIIVLSNFCTTRVVFRPYPSPIQLLTDSRFIQPPIWRTRRQTFFISAPSLQESRNRAYISVLPVLASDGMGNGFTTVNFEFLLARLLNVTYIHRVARYGSLSTESDLLAIERLFGWDRHPYIRKNFLQTVCAEIEMQHAPNCGRPNQKSASVQSTYPVCKKLRRKASFKHIVNIPRTLSACLIGKMTSNCTEEITKFSREHSKEQTLFQMIPDQCGNVYRNPDFRRTGVWFRNMYWNRHMKSTALTGGKNVTRVINGFREDTLQIAVHIRRGDFFLSKQRVLIGDEVYADVIAAVTRVARKMFGETVGIRAIIHSEGVPSDGTRIGHKHNMSVMESIYVDENQVKHGDGLEHWKKMMRRRGVGHVKISMQVGTDTIGAIHAMSCADVFIGSMSSMSRTLVGELARGVVLLPSMSKKLDENTKKSDWRIYYGYDNAEGATIDNALIEERLRTVLARVYPENL